MLNFTDSCAFSERKNLPCIMALYAVFSGETLLYIGCSTKLGERFVHHYKLEQFFAEKADIILFSKYDDATVLYNTEFEMIKQFKPKLNVAYRLQSAPALSRLKGVRPICDYNGQILPFVFNALWEFIENSESKAEALRQISEDIGLSISWLEKFARGETNDVGIKRIDTLCHYVTGKDIWAWIETNVGA